MDAFRKAQERSRAMVTSIESQALRMKAAGIDLTPSSMSGFDAMRDAGANKQRYNLFKGWMYSAVNALAQEAAGQPACIGQLLGEVSQEDQKTLTLVKDYQRNRMAIGSSVKAARQEIEILIDHPFLDVLKNPNPVQNFMQFVYSFVANLNLSGAAYIVADQEEGRLVLYSLPTTWVIPVHEPKPFSAYKIVDPKDPMAAADAPSIPAENVGRAYFPNPSDPLGVLSPTQSQIAAIRIDENIQTSQEVFFQNGVFPSVMITMGKEPLLGVSGAGTRPRLSGAQRRMVHSMIKRTMQDVSNHGMPVILDGLIENVSRFSSTQNEMGWDKSEDTIVTRILSAFSVHKFILGAEVKVSGYAQAAKIEERFCKRVNTFLSMLSDILTQFANNSEDGKFVVWLEKCEPTDRSIRSKEMQEGRKNGDVSRNEWRAEVGLPPLEDEEAERSKLLESVGGMQGTQKYLEAVNAGQMAPEQAVAVLVEFLQISPERASAMVGTGAVQQSEELLLEESNQALNAALDVIQVTPKQIAGKILSSV